MPYDETLAQMKARHARELAELLECRGPIRDALPDLGLTWKIHPYALFGTAASASIEFEYFERREQQPTIETVRAAGLALPAVSLVLVHDGCTSFQVADYVYARPIKPQEKIERVCSFYLRLASLDNGQIEFHWIARVAGFLVRVHVLIPTPRVLGYIHTTYDVLPGERIVNQCRFMPGPALGNIDGERPGALQSPIKFASGNRSTPNHFNLYFTGSATVADLAERIINHREKP